MTRGRKPTTTSRRWPCIFADQTVKAQVDPVIARDWQALYGEHAPFGDLRNMWRRHHCRTLNPYGSESCPYSERQCALAFAAAVSTVSTKKRRSPVGYFIRVAKSDAARRADQKPLARDRTMSDVNDATVKDVEKLTTPGPGDPGTASVRPEPGPWVRGPEDRPFSIGDVLRSLNLGPRKEPPDDGEAGTE